MLKSRSFFVNISKYRIRKENLAFLSNQPVIAIRREDGNVNKKYYYKNIHF